MPFYRKKVSSRETFFYRFKLAGDAYNFLAFRYSLTVNSITLTMSVIVLFGLITQCLFQKLCFHTTCWHISLRFKKIAMNIEDLDTAMAERKWRKQFIKAIREHGDIDDAIKQLINIFGPFLVLELFNLAFPIAAHLIQIQMMVL